MAQNNKEYEQTVRRIAYNNSWPSCGAWKSDLIDKFEAQLNMAGVPQLFCPIHFNEDVAAKVLYEEYKLNKIVSNILDSYDELPLHPDYGFDITWRAFEIMMHLHVNTFDQSNSNQGLDTLFSRIVDSVFIQQINHSQLLKDSFHRLFCEDMSWSALHYSAARLFLLPDIQINKSDQQCPKRCESIIGKNAYDDLKDKFLQNGGLDAVNHRKVTLLLNKYVIPCNEFVLSGNHKYTLSIQQSLTFCISCILYTSRCERVHGDYFSPFKSERSSLRQYYDYYWLMLVSYTLTMLLILKYCEKKELSSFFSVEDVCQSVNNTLDRLKKLLENKL